MPRRKGVWRQQWAFCDRCGFEFPLSMLIKQQSLLVCSMCHDNLMNDGRDQVISRILSDGREGENPKVDKQSEDDSFEVEF
jgi:hypothetical protein